MKRNLVKVILSIVLCLMLVLGTFSVNANSNVNELVSIMGTWEQDENGSWIGSGGGNGFNLTDIKISGKADFTVEMDMAGEAANGFGFAIIEDEFDPQNGWFCFQADTKENSYTFFHIANGSAQWNNSVPFGDVDKAKKSFHLKLTYVAETGTIKMIVDDVVIGEQIDKELNGYIGLKTYECTATFSNIMFTGSELPASKATNAPTEVPTTSATAVKTVEPSTTVSNSGPVSTTKAIVPTSTTKKTDVNGKNNTFIIIAAVVIIIAAASVTVFVIKKKK